MTNYLWVVDGRIVRSKSSSLLTSFKKPGAHIVIAVASSEKSTVSSAVQINVGNAEPKPALTLIQGRDIPGDANHDCVINGLDLVLVSTHWLQTKPDTSGTLFGDVNNDGIVNGLDISLIASHWGAQCAFETATPTPTKTVAPPIATNTAIPTYTATPSATVTRIATPQATPTRVGTATPTRTSSATPTKIADSVATSTPAQTVTPMRTPSKTPTPVATATRTATPTMTPTNLPGVASSFTMTGPTSVSFGYVSKPYTITPNGKFTGQIVIYRKSLYGLTILPDDGSKPETQIIYTWNNSSAPRTFTVQLREAWNPDGSGAFAGMMHDSIAAFAMYGAISGAPELPLTITARPVHLTRPYSEEIYQQSGGTADIKITGFWTTTDGESPTALQASWKGGSWMTIWNNSSGASGTEIPFSGVLPAQSPGSGELTVRWANNTSRLQTATTVTVGDVSTQPFQPPLPPATFSVPYSLPSGGGIWNIGATGGVGDSAAFQAALHKAKLGDVIVLQAGATYLADTRSAHGNGSANDLTAFRLEDKTGSGWIYITTSDYAHLPTPGNRVAPSNSSSMATILALPGDGTTTNGFPAIMSIGAAHHYRFVGINFKAVDHVYNMVWLGETAATWDVSMYDPSLTNATDTKDLPHHIVFDRCLFQQERADKSMQAAVLANGAYIAIMDSYITGCHSSAEANAIFIWNGTGPFKITNNYMEATASEIMLGAADPTVVTDHGAPYELVPSDLEITGNFFEKLPIHNPNEPVYDGHPWLTKNHFEIKSAQRALISGNVFKYSNGLGAGQQGRAIVFTPRNSGGAAPYSVCQDINFTNNIVRDSGQGFVLTGPDGHDMWKYAGTKATRRVAITNNIFDGISDFFKAPAYPGPDDEIGTIIGTNRDSGGPIDSVIAHNTFLFGPNRIDQPCSFNIATSVVTCPNHNLRDGQKVMFTGSLPKGLPAEQTLWVHVLDANTFTVWGAVANQGSNAYYVFPLQFSDQKIFSGTDTGGGKLKQRYGYYAFALLDSPPITAGHNFRFDDNIIELGTYGIFLNGTGSGTQVLDQVMKNYTFQGNILVGSYNGADYPARGSTPNGHANDIPDIGFTDYTNRNYLLSSTSQYKRKASDGTDPGVDWSTLIAATQYSIGGQTAGH